MALKQGISSLAKPNPLHLFLEDASRYPSEKSLVQETPNISLDDYFLWQKAFRFDFCSYLFTQELSWCLTTTEDSPMFLCVKEDIIPEVREAFDLELFNVDYDQPL